MKYIFPLLLLLLGASRLSAQDAAYRHVASLSARERPEFPGGSKELKKYLSLNLRYPHQAIELKVEGEVVVGFVIDEQGSIQDVKVMKGIGYGCEEEAIRVVKAMPQWRPAVREGKGIKVLYRLPVVFELPAVKGTPAD